jgi:hypothetical protein
MAEQKFAINLNRGNLNFSIDYYYNGMSYNYI